MKIKKVITSSIKARKKNMFCRFRLILNQIVTYLIILLFVTSPRHFFQFCSYTVLWIFWLISSQDPYKFYRPLQNCLVSLSVCVDSLRTHVVSIEMMVSIGIVMLILSLYWWQVSTWKKNSCTVYRTWTWCSVHVESPTMRDIFHIVLRKLI